MNKIIFSLMCCLFFAGQAMAQQALSGSIMTADNTPVTGATVVATSVTGSESGTISDMDGSFSLNLADAGDYKLNISYIGYVSFSKNVTISSGNNTEVGKINLNEESQNMQSVEVVGRRRNDKNICI